MTKLQGSFIWYELMTTDAPGAKAFYDAVVGWNIDAASASPDMEYRMINRPDGGMTGGVFTLNDEMLGQGARPCWMGYIGVDDCDAAAKAVEAKGGKVVMPPMDVPMAGRIAMVSDCCGAAYYIMTPTPPPGGGESTAFSVDGLGVCGWNELYAGDLDNAIAFYTSLYGWTLPEPMMIPMGTGPMAKYQFINHEDVTLGAIMQKPPQAPMPYWNHYFRVASIAAAKAAVEAGGGTVMHGPMEVPGGDWVINGMDPQGAAFALVGGK